jgi:hypothetical protein
MWVMVSFAANGSCPGEANVPCATADAGAALTTAAVSSAAKLATKQAGVKRAGTVDLRVSVSVKAGRSAKVRGCPMRSPHEREHHQAVI